MTECWGENEARVEVAEGRRRWMGNRGSLTRYNQVDDGCSTPGTLVRQIDTLHAISETIDCRDLVMLTAYELWPTHVHGYDY